MLCPILTYSAAAVYHSFPDRSSFPNEHQNVTAEGMVVMVVAVVMEWGGGVGVLLKKSLFKIRLKFVQLSSDTFIGESFT